MYKIILSKQSELFYLNANDKLCCKFNKVFDILSKQPYFGSNIKKLKGSLAGLYRYRIGDFRIVYSIENQISIVSIVWIGNRKNAYK